MKKILKSMVFLGILISIFQNVYGDVPNRTVVIGENAFTLEYANDKKNIDEIRENINKSGGKIFIKVNNKWFDNKREVIKDYSIIPQIKYKDSNGVIKSYKKGDGELIRNDIKEINNDELKALKDFFLVVVDDTIEVGLGSSKRLRIINPTKIHYDVVKVNGSGVDIKKDYNYIDIIGKKLGTSVITIKLKNRVISLVIHVTPDGKKNPNELIVNVGDELNLKVGEEYTLLINGEELNKSDVKMTYNGEGLISVDDNGKIKALKKGEVDFVLISPTTGLYKKIVIIIK
ncbi:hypothetical protein [Oceanirhabdus sp. W0125-5]|uniref:hypothetical protein n=1 Tax=Oceanirhabdus sp. W0125-5 TaxID=2999116 RepID=UPI0022F2C3D9|nr:hypothetical protein [Oceanirhabdus sp. W0125-5]WBW99575.1 hypothetical protein OW730_12750 [Oceanirhabdus sp. W0125-5]